MRHFAIDSGKSKGQFLTPAEVSRVKAQVLQIEKEPPQRPQRCVIPFAGRALCC